MRSSAAFLVAGLVAASGSAQAQLRTVVVPPGAGVVVPPRGAVPRLAARPPGVAPWAPAPAASIGLGVPLAGVGVGAVAVPLAAIALPVIAGAVLGGGSGGAGSVGTGGGGVSSPSRTR